MQLDRSRRYRTGIESKNLINLEGIDDKRFSIDRGGIKRLSSKQRLQRIDLMDRAIYQEISRTNPKISIEETYIEVLSSFYQGGIKYLSRSLKQGFSREKQTQDGYKQDRHQNKQPRSMLSTQTHHQL